MKSLISLADEIFNKYYDLNKYINKLKSDPTENAYYRANQEIIYIGLVNKIYSLWETYNKSIVYNYFEILKNKIISEGSFVQRLYLHELPGYITETGKYDVKKNTISYDLKEEYITYIRKNIDANELKVLYKRFHDLDIISYLESSHQIKSVLSQNFETDITLQNALKLIINERNSISHQPILSDFQGLPILQNWIAFLRTMSIEISKTLCNEYIKIKALSLTPIGIFKKYFKSDNILAIDIANGININTSTPIYLFKRNRLSNIYLPKSFMINGESKSSVACNDKAGIKLKSVFYQEENINSTNQVYVII